jgi:hypothetical protein
VGCVSKGVSLVLGALEVDWKRCDGNWGGMRWAHRRHGAVVLCVRKADVLDVEGSDARNLRAAEGRRDRIAVFSEIICSAPFLVSDG